MVFCRGCAKEIHNSAVTCPACGAPQAAAATAAPVAAAPAPTGIWYFEVLKKYAVFSGRARRKEYWMFFLVNILVAMVLGFIEGVAGTGAILSNLYSLALLIPGIAVGVRRMHDTDRSGWWLLLPIVNLIFLCQDSQPGPNRFGPNPKGIA
ncbi:DUF805 domain-containing protein [Pseudomonas wadenswilerensis]|jgi:uncharacterized membrane protein YhaH (DUF805 family)|nr:MULTISPECIES: DUF805 domain-containing protein [Pseudomonas]MCE5983147.1 DUF805 domain-containing protein [Pseudomonas sp. LF19]UVM24493.1 DUF805 domain-containing protein [Pseudomonas wadenswilerensis]